MLPDRRWSPNSRSVASLYLEAKAFIIDRGFADEIDWQSQASFHLVNESTFLREAAWVVLSSGLSEKVVRARFANVCGALGGLQCAKDVWRHRRAYRTDALLAFRSPRKIDAILAICGYVSRYSFERCCSLIESEGVDFLARFPQLGPATSRHLAKNLGFSVAKPDRHLVRIASALGYESAAALCAELNEVVGDSVAVVDLVLWRYATLIPDYLAILRSKREAALEGVS